VEAGLFAEEVLVVGDVLVGCGLVGGGLVGGGLVGGGLVGGGLVGGGLVGGVLVGGGEYGVVGGGVATGVVDRVVGLTEGGHVTPTGSGPMSPGGATFKWMALIEWATPPFVPAPTV